MNTHAKREAMTSLFANSKDVRELKAYVILRFSGEKKYDAMQASVATSDMLLPE